MEKATCPHCGASGHAVASNDGRMWKYTCERCKAIFIVDTKTGESAPIGGGIKRPDLR